jgi:plastocyanin
MILRRLVVVSLIPQLALVVACGRSPVEPANVAPVQSSSAAAVPRAGAPSGPNALVAGRQDVLVNMLDACDPDSFNAVLGPGTCVRSGGVTFDQFIGQLTRLAFAAPWRFAPQNTVVRVGQTFVAENRGGEVHTFTEVDEFGGGIVPVLNQLAHTPTIAPACAALEGDDFVAPGGAYREEVDHAGTLKFQCCIHPWMRMEASVR